MKADRDFKAIKKREIGEEWIQKQVNEKSGRQPKGVKSSELFKILRPKQMIARSAGKLIRHLPGLDWTGWAVQKGTVMKLLWSGKRSLVGIENTEEVSVAELLNRSLSTMF